MFKRWLFNGFLLFLAIIWCLPSWAQLPRKKERNEHLRISTCLNMMFYDPHFIENHISKVLVEKVRIPPALGLITLMIGYDFNRTCLEYYFSVKSLRASTNNLKFDFSYVEAGMNYGYYFNQHKIGVSKAILGMDVIQYSYQVKDPFSTSTYQYFVASNTTAYLTLGYEYLFNFPVKTNRLGPLVGLRCQFKQPIRGNNWGLRNSQDTRNIHGVFEVGLNIGFVR